MVVSDIHFFLFIVSMMQTPFLCRRTKDVPGVIILMTIIFLGDYKTISDFLIYFSSLLLSRHILFCMQPFSSVGFTHTNLLV